MAAQLCACSSIQPAHWMPDGAKPYCSHCLEDFDALNRRARDVSSAATAPQASHDRQPASASASLWHCSLPVVAAVACLPWPRPPAVACDSHRRVGFGLGLGAQLAPPDVGGMAPRAVERRGDSDLGRLGSPEAALSARSRSRPPGASVSLGQAAAWAVLGPRPHRPCFFAQAPPLPLLWRPLLRCLQLQFCATARLRHRGAGARVRALPHLRYRSAAAAPGRRRVHQAGRVTLAPAPGPAPAPAQALAIKSGAQTLALALPITLTLTLTQP